MAKQYGKGGVKHHITSRYPHNALFCSAVLESKDISGIERRKKAHLSRYNCSVILLWENIRTGIRKERQQYLHMSIHREYYQCSQPNRRNYPEE